MESSSTSLNKDKTLEIIDEHWDSWYVKGLSEFIEIPNLTPMVDPDYLTNGLNEKAIEHVDKCINDLKIQGISKKFFQPKGVCPMIVYVVEKSPGASDTQVMFYGHLDKQPWLDGWADGLGPTKPVIRDGCLYGRGGGDDGYAPYSAMLAIKNAQQQGVPHPRCALVLETEEESGSPSLIDLLKLAKDFIGDPDYLFCLDSGAFDYDHLWLTSSLRGCTSCDVTVKAGCGGYHSGEVGGIVPETFRVARHLLNRLDDSETGVVMKELETQLPAYAMPEAERMAVMMKDSMKGKYKMEQGVEFVSTDMVKTYLNNTWKPNLSVTGAGGLPAYEKAGNVVRPSTTLRLSMRLPPNMNCHDANKIIEEKLVKDVPHNCVVEVKGGHGGNGWCMKEPQPWLHELINNAAQAFYGKDYGSYGMGGSIPFLAELGNLYPKTFILAMGVLGPKSNAHAADEMINLGYAKKLTCCLSHIIVDAAAKAK